jgi:hypothetical protein
MEFEMRATLALGLTLTAALLAAGPTPPARPAPQGSCWLPVAVERVSRDSSGGETYACIAESACPPCKNNTHTTISALGDRVVFSSDAFNVTPTTSPAPTSHVRQIYLRFVGSGVTWLISTPTFVAPALPTLGDHCSDMPDISRDGDYVVFDSSASNLAPGDLSVDSDVFLHDVPAHSTIRVSVNSNGTEFNYGSRAARVCKDATVVVFVTGATNVNNLYAFGSTSAFPTSGIEQVLARTEPNGDFEWISAPVSGVADGKAEFAAIDEDGRYVAFTSQSTGMLGSPDPNGATEDVFVRDRATGGLVAISVDAAGNLSGNGQSRRPAISDTGRYVVFESAATNLIGTGTWPATLNIYVRDRDADGDGVFDEVGDGVTRLMSVDSAGGASQDSCGYPAISGDGRIVVFTSREKSFHPCDAGQLFTQFIFHDRDTNGNGVFDEASDPILTAIASKTPANVYANGLSGGNCGISETGQFAVYNSEGANLVSGDFNGPEYAEQESVYPTVGRDIFRVQFFP